MVNSAEPIVPYSDCVDSALRKGGKQSTIKADKETDEVLAVEKKQLIWCVEDDENIREIERYTLESTGFLTVGFEDGSSFWSALADGEALPDLLLLDVMLPGEDGIEILKKLRQRRDTEKLPVIMATAKGMEYDRIKGLDLGADDYLVKPFSMLEMVSRVRAVLRRSGQTDNTERTVQLTAASGGVVVDEAAHRVLVDDEAVKVTLKEYELLKLFLKNPRRIFSRDELFNLVWGEDYCGETRTVDIHIGTLRQKLGNHGVIISTVRGVGYGLNEE